MQARGGHDVEAQQHDINLLHAAEVREVVDLLYQEGDIPPVHCGSLHMLGRARVGRSQSLLLVVS